MNSSCVITWRSGSRNSAVDSISSLRYPHPVLCISKDSWMDSLSPKEFRWGCLKRNGNRFLLSKADQKFFQVLVIGGCRWKSDVQRLLFVVRLLHDSCKGWLFEQSISCLKVFFGNFLKVSMSLISLRKSCSSFCFASIENGILYSPTFEVTHSHPVHTSPGCIPVPSAPYGTHTIVPENRLLPGTNLRSEEVMYPLILSLSSVPRYNSPASSFLLPEWWTAYPLKKSSCGWSYLNFPLSNCSICFFNIVHLIYP